MDIHQLIDTVSKLTSKVKDLEKMELAKKQMIEEVNRDLSKAYQSLENKVKDLEKIIDNKLNGLKRMDDELAQNRALLAKMNNTQNVNYSQQPVNGHNSAANKVGIDPNNNQQIKFPQPQAESNFMNNSLEDFIAQNFQKEYNVKYPENGNIALSDQDFGIVLSTIKTKAKQSGNLSAMINEYLSNYSQTLNESQIRILEEERNRGLEK